MKDTKSLMAIAILFATQPVFGAQQESITMEPSTGDYIIWYVGDDDALKIVTWIPATKINPVVKSGFRDSGDGLFRYTYQIRNETSSWQNVADAAIQVSSLQDGETAPGCDVVKRGHRSPSPSRASLSCAGLPFFWLLFVAAQEK